MYLYRPSEVVHVFLQRLPKHWDDILIYFRFNVGSVFRVSSCLLCYLLCASILSIALTLFRLDSFLPGNLYRGYIDERRRHPEGDATAYMVSDGQAIKIKGGGNDNAAYIYIHRGFS